jgi:hypothetical protein
MDLGGRNHFAVLLTLLTERMCCDVLISNPFPSPAVPFPGLGVTVIHLVALCLELLMLLTEPSIGQLRTARIGTGAFGFSRHRVHLVSGHEKTSAVFHGGSLGSSPSDDNDIKSGM